MGVGRRIAGKFFLLPALNACFGLILMGQAGGQTLTVLHSFESVFGPNTTNCDGANPSGTLVLSGNTLYGTAAYGGSAGWGTVFSVNVSGADFTTRHHFTGGSDGASPLGGVILWSNWLYGTASSGGGGRAGTVFASGTNGADFLNLHSFTAPANDGFGFYTNGDGAYPYVGLTLAGNTLYGAANDGGSSGFGTLFAVGTNGSGFQIVHNFSSGSGGAYSSAGLILASNKLYGADYGNLGHGTVFTVNTDGTGFTNLYAFSSGHLNGNGVLTNSDGANPHAKLVLAGNTLYGTTEYGGNSGHGVIFAMTTAGTDFRALHSFAAGAYNPSGLLTNSDGANPAAELLLSGNRLYGTTTAGDRSGNGTLFMLDLNGGVFTNLYHFTATPPYPQPPINSDGANPSGGLVSSGYTFYGVTAYGGISGNGTVFSLSFAPRLTITSFGTMIVLTWPASASGFDYSGFKLQSASAVTGPFADVLGATSPYTNFLAGAQRFYRLSQ
jgi:uncharacterized repeat protein (TIGR03803 family)